MTMTPSVSFQHTLDTLFDHDRAERAIALFCALVKDMGDPGQYWTEETPKVRLKQPTAASLAEVCAVFEGLSWAQDASYSLLYDLLDAPDEPSKLGTPYGVAWLNITLSLEDETPNLPAQRVRDMRQLLVRLLGYEDKEAGAQVDESLVVILTMEGAAYDRPDLYIAGPAVAPDGSGDRVEGVHVRRLPFHKVQASMRAKDGQLRDQLDHIAPLHKHSSAEWRKTFTHSFTNLDSVRQHFRKKLSESLCELMMLLEGLAGSPTEAHRLRALREAGTLLIFRLMFILEVERRGLLYDANTSSTEPALIELMTDFGDTDTKHKPGALLSRLREVSLAVRGDLELERPLAVRGASIFSNRPNEGFAEDELTLWLDALDVLDLTKLSAPQLQRWDDALYRAGSVATGELSEQFHMASSRLGAGAEAHTHRILGDVYEQILALVPTRQDDGSLKLLLSANSKANKKEQDEEEGGEGEDSEESEEESESAPSKAHAKKGDERSSLGAHYTPPELVEEIVRPALGHLFAQSWAQAKGDVKAYKVAVEALRVCDPAMGSAHFLTVSALEIARELAWVELNQAPRDFAWHEPMRHVNPIGPNPADFDPDTRKDDSDFALLLPPKYGGQGSAEDYDLAVRRLIPRVVQDAIYGVDLNPLASELGKLSLWLFTLTAGTKDARPELAFLDGNIKCGNSLLGVTFEEARKELNDRLGLAFPEETFSLLNQTTNIYQALARAEEYQRYMRMPADELCEKASGYPQVSAGMDTMSLHYAAALRERFYDASMRSLELLRWVYDLAVLCQFYDVSTRGNKNWATLRELLGAQGASYDDDASFSSALNDLLRPSTGTGDVQRNALRIAIERAGSQLPSTTGAQRALHWELAFPAIFPTTSEAVRGFHLIVANPPFVGDRKLRAFLGAKTLDVIKHRYMNGVVGDLCAFFVLRFDQLTRADGVVSTIGPNSLAQTSNRRYALVPMVAGDSPRFSICRARQSERWPGEASVFICTILMVRKLLTEKFYQRIQQRILLDNFSNEPISSYLDIGPETAFISLFSMNSDICLTGHFMRGQYFLPLLEDETLQQAIERVPPIERTSLFAYVNNKEVQQQATPIPTRLAIDLYDDLEAVRLHEAPAPDQLAWLKNHRPFLLNALDTVLVNEKVSVKSFRQALPYNKKNAPHVDCWWQFAYPRIGLKTAMKNADYIVVFGAVSKVWAPYYLSKIEVTTGLPICPSNKLFISTVKEKSFFGVLASFLFEVHMRREASTLETRLNVTPTESLTVFPMPWKSVWDTDKKRPVMGAPSASMEQAIGVVVDRLLAQRQAILEHPSKHGITQEMRNKQWGPTDLYNLYDDQDVTLDSVEELRAIHRELLEAVVTAYGWGEMIPTIKWGFEQPWIDRTMRYVPDAVTRAALFERLNALNAKRYEHEIELYLPHVIGEMVLNKAYSLSMLDKQLKESGLSISKEDLEVVLKRASHGKRATLHVSMDKRGKWTRDR